MNKLFTVLFLSLLAFVFSCQPTANKPTETAENTGTLEDSLYKATMDIHNELMPKMGKIMGYQKQAQKQMDSIKSVLSSTTFPTEVARRIATDVNTLDTLNESLKTAEKGMNDWMDGFDPDPKMPTTEERAAYFADQKEKAETMKTQFLQALASAENFFSKK
jgi:hypothetical protein